MRDVQRRVNRIVKITANRVDVKCFVLIYVVFHLPTLFEAMHFLDAFRDETVCFNDVRMDFFELFNVLFERMFV